MLEQILPSENEKKKKKKNGDCSWFNILVSCQPYVCGVVFGDLFYNAVII